MRLGRKLFFGYLRTARAYFASPKGGRDVRDWARAAGFVLLTAGGVLLLLCFMGV